MKKRLFALCTAFFICFTVIGCDSGETSQLSDTSHSYQEQNEILYHNIGKKLNVKAYINDIEIDTPVYLNTTADEISGLYTSYVELRPSLEAIGAKVSFSHPNTVEADINGNIKKITINRVMYYGSENVYSSGDYSVIAVDGKTYVEFYALRVLLGGNLSDSEENKIILYTPDFERTDIPGNLTEAYAALDKELSGEVREKIKNAKEDELIEFHFSIGGWIRNNWIRPTANRVAKEFLDRGVNVPDDISYYILQGYRLYLKGEPCAIEDILED